MHDVQLHFGDIQKSWAKHDAESKGMLFDLLCAYYDREGPLPDDLEELEEIAGAATRTQKAKLPRLLKKHLVRVEKEGAAVWQWARCDLEIARFKHRCAVNSHNNLLKFCKNSSGAVLAPEFEDFASRIDHFVDPITKRFRNLRRADEVGTNGNPKVSDSEIVGMPKSPTSGVHSPTLPLSHSPTLPTSPELPPVIPQGGCNGADAKASQSDSGKGYSTPSETGISAGKKKRGARRNPLVWPPNWFGERRELMEGWLRYKSERGQGYKPMGFLVLLGKLDALPITKLRETIETSMAANYAGLFPERGNGEGHQPPAFGSRREPSVEQAFPLMPTPPNGSGAPAEYEAAWEAMFGERSRPGWTSLPESLQGELREWISEQKKERGEAE